jgi:uncharacterized protein
MPTHTPILSEPEVQELHDLLDDLPEPLEPLNGNMLDGFLCGVLLQPQTLSAEQWLPCVYDSEGRLPPASFDLERLQALVLRRHAELNQAIEKREWFDPWIYQLAPEELDEDELEELGHPVMPWIAGFVTAMELFPQLLDLDAQHTLEPLAMIYQHIDPEDLEDADDLLDMIESLEPPADLTEAVEQLVRATLLLADVSRPNRAGASKNAPKRR